MNGFFSMTLRELHERRAVLPAAAVAALIPVVVPLMSNANKASAREVTVWFVAAVLGAGLGLLLGANALAPDLVEGRLGFYFAQPVSGLAIWGGKIVASVLLAFVASVLPLAVVFTAGLVSPGWTRWLSGGWFEGVLALFWLSLTSVALGHFWSVVVRSRSRWQVVDVAGLLLCSAGIWWAASLLRRSFAFEALTFGFWTLTVAIPLSLLVAGAVQTAGGRTDLQRGHRLLSLTMWSVLGVVVLILLVGAYWMVTPNPDDLVRIAPLSAAPTGPWVALDGTSRGRGDFTCGFLIDESSRHWTRIPAGSVWPNMIAFSGDGRRAVWTVPQGNPESETGKLVLAELGEDRVRLRTTPIALGSIWTSRPSVALDEDGSRVAVVDGSGITVSSLPDGALLAAVKLPERLVASRTFFVGPDRVRVYGWREVSAKQDVLVIGELDVARRRFETTGRLELPSRYPEIRLDEGLQRLATVHVAGDSRQPAIFNAVTGELLIVLDRPGWTPEAPPAFLADGGVVLAERHEDEHRLRITAPDGAERVLVLPQTEGRYRPALQPHTGMLLVGASGGSFSTRENWHTLIVDLSAGTVRDLGAGFPAFGGFAWNLQRTPPPGSVGTRLLVTGSQLLALDPDLQSTSVVAGTGSD